MKAVAKAKYQKGSPQKARLVIDLVRGKNVSQALAILKYTNKRAAGPIAKCLNSAIANATYKAEQENIAIDPDDLWIDKCYVDMGPTKNRRRLRPAPQGRAYFERRHYCHITIEVTSDPMPEEEEEKTYEKRGKKVMAKKAGGGKKAKSDKKAKDDKKADEVKEAKADAEKVEEEVTETKAEETKPKEEKVVADTEETAKEETKSEEKAEAKTDDAEEAKADEKEAKADDDAKSDDKAEETDASDAPNPEVSEDPIGEAIPANKPLAAETDEEKTGTEEAADRQIDENEELERQ